MGSEVRLLAAFGLFAAMCAMPLRAIADVTVERKPTVVERKTFDPAHPPADMPPLSGHEAALTQSQYDCSVKLAYEVTDRKNDGAQCTTSLRVRSVRVSLQLKIVIWLPRGAPEQLIAHEEGHRQIDERIFGRADEVARSLASHLDGSELSAQADDCTHAERKATGDAVNRFCHDYLDHMVGRAEDVNAIYDQLTAHGTKAELAPEEAIRQAFARADKHDRKAAGGQKR